MAPCLVPSLLTPAGETGLPSGPVPSTVPPLEAKRQSPWCSGLGCHLQCRHPTRAPVPISAAPFLVQVLANVLGTAAGDSAGAWACAHKEDPNSWLRLSPVMAVNSPGERRSLELVLWHNELLPTRMPAHWEAEGDRPRVGAGHPVGDLEDAPGLARPSAIWG